MWISHIISFHYLKKCPNSYQKALSIPPPWKIFSVLTLSSISSGYQASFWKRREPNSRERIIQVNGLQMLWPELVGNKEGFHQIKLELCIYLFPYTSFSFVITVRRFCPHERIWVLEHYNKVLV